LNPERPRLSTQPGPTAPSNPDAGPSGIQLLAPRAAKGNNILSKTFGTLRDIAGIGVLCVRIESSRRH
jgi:hypothetical protein